MIDTRTRTGPKVRAATDPAQRAALAWSRTIRTATAHYHQGSATHASMSAAVRTGTVDSLVKCYTVDCAPRVAY